MEKRRKKIKKKIDDEEYNLNMYYVYCDNESFYLKADQFTYL